MASVKVLHCAPSYLSEVCKSEPEASRHVRLSGAITCVIPWSRTRLGDRSFDVAGPRLWNKLSASLRSSDSLAQFRRQFLDAGYKYSYLLTYLLLFDSDYVLRRHCQRC